MSEHSAAAFFDVWHTYRKVVAANYMHHMEIRAQLERVLLAQFVGRPFSFLDLGCGDAATLAPLLASMAVQRYKGVDLSESALALAAVARRVARPARWLHLGLAEGFRSGKRRKRFGSRMS
jgi:SAM-dependent methyltransferase